MFEHGVDVDHCACSLHFNELLMLNIELENGALASRLSMLLMHEHQAEEGELVTVLPRLSVEYNHCARTL